MIYNDMWSVQGLRSFAMGLCWSDRSVRKCLLFLRHLFVLHVDTLQSTKYREPTIRRRGASAHLSSKLPPPPASLPHHSSAARTLACHIVTSLVSSRAVEVNATVNAQARRPSSPW